MQKDNSKLSFSGIGSELGLFTSKHNSMCPKFPGSHFCVQGRKKNNDSVLGIYLTGNFEFSELLLWPIDHSVLPES